MSNMAQTINRLGHWVEDFQKKSHALHMPPLVKRQTAESNGDQLLADEMQLPYSQRLIVIVPGLGIDDYALANKLWSLASPDHREILLIGVFDRIENEFQARRNLASLAAATRDKFVKVQVQIVESKSLLKTLRRSQQIGDILLCPSKMVIPDWFSKRNLLDSLAGVRTVPLYCLDLKVQEERSGMKFLRKEYALALFGLLTLIAMSGVLFLLHQEFSGKERMFFEFLTLLVAARILWGISDNVY